MKRKERLKMVLEFSNYIDGEDAKRVNDLCKEIVKLKPICEDMNKKLNQLKNELKEMLQGGTNETTKYIVKMTEKAGSTTIKASDVRTKEPDIFDLLESKGLVKHNSPSKVLGDILAK